MNITDSYVERRTAQLAKRIADAYATLGRKDGEQTATLFTQRIKEKDYKSYGDTALHALHAAKRLAAYYIRHAIQFNPARQARIEEVRKQYAEKCKAELEKAPWLSFFSFEAAHAKQLRINFSSPRNAALLRLTPTSDVHEAACLA